MTTAMTPNDSRPAAVDQPVMGSGQMFDRIAARYDRLNAIMSFGMHHRWRRKLIESVGPLGAGDQVLDLATGTADVALALGRAYPDATVVGVDPSEEMLAVGRDKLGELKAPLSGRISLEVGDGQALSHADDTFAGVTIAFGIRNIPDRVQALREMARVTRPGGVVSVLELGEPRGGLLSPFARLHVRYVVPLMGKLLSSAGEYDYLQASMSKFPAPDVFAEELAQAGLVDIKVKRMSLGAVHLFTGRTP